MNLSDTAAPPLVELIDVFTERLNALYELLLEVYLARDVDGAPGAALDNLTSLAGVYRLPATYASTTVTLVGDGTATTVPAGSRMSVGAGGPVFATTVDVDLPAGAPYEANVIVEADTTGPQAYAIDAIDTVVDSVAHWSGVSASDAVDSGRDVELDAQLRLRFRRSIQRPGASTDGSARARLEAIENVEAAFVVSNRTDFVNPVTGQPAHSRWAVLYPNTLDQEAIATALWETAPAGIADYGSPYASQYAIVTDDQGYAQTVQWDWATTLEMWVTVNVNSHTWSTSLAVTNKALIKQHVVDYVTTLSVGEDVCPTLVVGYVLARVSGILDMDVLVATSNPPGAGDHDPVDVPFYNIALVPLANVSVP